MEHMAPAHYRRYPDISLAETSRGHPAPVPGPCLISCWGGGREGEGRRITARLLPEAVWLPHRPPHTASTGCQKLGTICNFFSPQLKNIFFCPARGVNCDVDDVVNIKLVTVTIKSVNIYLVGPTLIIEPCDSQLSRIFFPVLGMSRATVEAHCSCCVVIV